MTSASANSAAAVVFKTSLAALAATRSSQADYALSLVVVRPAVAASSVLNAVVAASRAPKVPDGTTPEAVTAPLAVTSAS